jgi:hypothetical protein
VPKDDGETWASSLNSIDEQCLFVEQTLESLEDLTLWKSLCPFLSIADNLCPSEFQSRSESLYAAKRQLGVSDAESLGDLLTRRGYFKLTPQDISLPDCICELLVAGINRLVLHGYPSTMILMYDEAWIVGDLLSSIIEKASGNVPIGDWFIFHVDPSNPSIKSYRPGPPHRDRPTADASSFRYGPAPVATIAAMLPLSLSVRVVGAITPDLDDSALVKALVNTNVVNESKVSCAVLSKACCIEADSIDIAMETCKHVDCHDGGNYEGAPMYCSVWLALTEASPETSCLYVVPKGADAGYMGSCTASDALTATSLNAYLPIVPAPACREGAVSYDWRDIVAQPLEPGGLLVFSHRLLHWGSNPQPHAGNGRLHVVLLLLH